MKCNICKSEVRLERTTKEMEINLKWVEKPPCWLKNLEKRLLKDYGPPCKIFTYSCMVCAVWMAFRILHEGYGYKFINIYNNKNKK